MSEVRKGTSRNTENENKRRKIFNNVLNMNWDYVRGKKKTVSSTNKTDRHDITEILYISRAKHYYPKPYMLRVLNLHHKHYMLFSYQTGYIMSHYRKSLTNFIIQCCIEYTSPERDSNVQR
jgi:hypothetical protein